MPRPVTVAVVGATGRQGGVVARKLLDRGHRVRALTRRPGSDAAAALQALGAEIRGADLEDGDAVRSAVEGSDAFFLMATPYEAGIEAEVRQARGALQAARDAGVPHVVYSSVGSADQETGVPHFDSKAEVERYLATLGVPHTILGPVFFMENVLGPMFLDALRGGELAMPLPERRPLQVVALADLAGLVSLAVERPGELAGRRLDVASDELTGPEMASAVARASGHGLRYVQSSLDPIRARSADLARMWEWFDQVGYRADLAMLRSSFPEVGWHDFGRWAREQDWSALGAADAQRPAT